MARENVYNFAAGPSVMPLPALEQARAGQLLPPNQLVPVYHRLSQAERERLEREQAAKRET